MELHIFGAFDVAVRIIAKLYQTISITFQRFRVQRLHIM